MHDPYRDHDIGYWSSHCIALVDVWHIFRFGENVNLFLYFLRTTVSFGINVINVITQNAHGGLLSNLGDLLVVIVPRPNELNKAMLQKLGHSVIKRDDLGHLVVGFSGCRYEMYLCRERQYILIVKWILRNRFNVSFVWIQVQWFSVRKVIVYKTDIIFIRPRWVHNTNDKAPITALLGLRLGVTTHRPTSLVFDF